MSVDLQKSLFKTFAYADIFDYPLTTREVLRFLISDTEVAVEVVQKILSLIVADCKLIDADGEFYFLRGRKGIVELRKKRAEWSKEKWKIAQETANKLKMIPTIKMIGVTGALAMENCEVSDDIDLMVITAADRLWLTRLILCILVPMLGIKRRRPKDKEFKDKICFNLFLDEEHLKIQPENLFLAHEICQIVPLINKDKTYEKLLWENRWVKKFLPNGVKISSKFPYRVNKVQSSKLGKKHPISQYPNIFISFLERLAYKLQYLYMKPKITNEKIFLYQTFFHPTLLGKKIEEEFKLRLKKYNINNG